MSDLLNTGTTFDTITAPCDLPAENVSSSNSSTNIITIENLINQKEFLNSLHYTWTNLKIGYLQLNYEHFGKKSINDITLMLYFLADYDRLFTIADKLAKGEKTGQQYAKLTQNLVQGGLKLTGELATLVGLSEVVPVLNIIAGAIAVASFFVNFATITALQRSDDAEHHLDTYRKIVHNWSIEYEPAKNKIHKRIQDLRTLRPKCQSYTKDCELEHTRYWIQTAIYREFIDSFKNAFDYYFKVYDETKFLSLLENNNIDINKFIQEADKNYEMSKKINFSKMSINLKNISKEISKAKKISESKKTLTEQEKNKTQKINKNLFDIIFDIINTFLNIFSKSSKGL